MPRHSTRRLITASIWVFLSTDSASLTITLRPLPRHSAFNTNRYGSNRVSAYPSQSPPFLNFPVASCTCTCTSTNMSGRGKEQATTAPITCVGRVGSALSCLMSSGHSRVAFDSVGRSKAILFEALSLGRASISWSTNCAFAAELLATPLAFAVPLPDAAVATTPLQTHEMSNS